MILHDILTLYMQYETIHLSTKLTIYKSRPGHAEILWEGTVQEALAQPVIYQLYAIDSVKYYSLTNKCDIKLNRRY